MFRVVFTSERAPAGLEVSISVVISERVYVCQTPAASRRASREAKIKSGLPHTLILIHIIKTPYFAEYRTKRSPARARPPRRAGGPERRKVTARTCILGAQPKKAPCGTLARAQTLPGSRARCSSQSSAALPRRTYRSSPPRVVGAATMVSARAFDRWRRCRGTRAASARRGPRRFV